MPFQKRIAVFGSFLANSHSAEYQMADELGYLLARNGFKAACGGHGGISAALAAGVNRGGGEIQGISLSRTRFPRRSAEAVLRVTETVTVNTVSERLENLLNSNGFVFFTGGIGSLAEFSFIWHSLQLEGDWDRPVILVSGAWKRLLAAIRLEQMIKQKYYRHIYLCERVKDAVAILTGDYSIKYDDPEDVFCKECVLFDLDGTMVESPQEEFIRLCEDIGFFFRLPDVSKAFKRAGHFQRIPEGSAAARDQVSCLITVLENLGMNGRAAADIADQVCKGSKQVPDLYADVTDVLRCFKEDGFATGVVSSCHPLQLQEILAAHDLSGSFDFVFAPYRSAEEHSGRRFEEALERFGFRKDEAVHVGDGFQDDALDPRAVDSILLDRHLSRILGDYVPTIRSLRELKYMIRHRCTALA